MTSGKQDTALPNNPAADTLLVRDGVFRALVEALCAGDCGALAPLHDHLTEHGELPGVCDVIQRLLREDARRSPTREGASAHRATTVAAVLITLGTTANVWMSVAVGQSGSGSSTRSKT